MELLASGAKNWQVNRSLYNKRRPNESFAMRTEPVMATTQDDIDSFHHFATNHPRRANGKLSIDELFMLWFDQRDRTAINESICNGLSGIDAGRFQPAKAAMDELWSSLGVDAE